MTSQQGQVRRVSLQARAIQEIVPALVAGLVSGTLVVVVAIALAALIFAGDLSEHVSAGIGIMLFGAAAINILTGLAGSAPGVISSIQDSPAAILALVAAAIASRMPASATAQETFVTVIAAIVLTAFLTGIAFLLLGQFRLGNLIRFIPYPVIGGFLGGTGLLLIRGAVGVMTGLPVKLSDLAPVFQADPLQKWFPGLVFAVLLLVILRRRSHFLILPGMLIAAILVFYAALLLTGTSVSEATDHGWLLNALPEGGGGLWKPWLYSDFDQVNWSALVSQGGSIAAIVVVSAIALLLNATGLELVTEQTVDLNRELKAVGLANLASGLVGSGVGFHTLSLSVLAHKMGVRNRLPGLVVAGLCGLVLVAGGTLLTYFPNPVLGGLLLFLGLDLLLAWVYDAWFRLPKTDYAVAVSILLVINLVGFLEGIGLGLVLAVILFVVNYSRIHVVKYTLTGATYHSNVVRPPLYQQMLRAKGDWTYIVRLQGFIFFGTANKLLDQVRARINDPALAPPHFIVLDFRLVTGLDSSAVSSFARMKQLTQAREMILVFTHLSPDIQRQLAKGVLQQEHYPLWRIFPDLDHGVEWCENMAIEMFENTESAARPKTLMQQLEESLPAPTGMARLMHYLERQEVEAGHTLIRQGDPSEGMYFIEGGQVTVQLEAGSGEVVRLRRMDAGTIVGELRMYLGRPATASVVAEQPSTLYYLTSDVLQRMEQQDPELASAFHRFMARFLAERLVQTTDTLQALVD